MALTSVLDVTAPAPKVRAQNVKAAASISLHEISAFRNITRSHLRTRPCPEGKSSRFLTPASLFESPNTSRMQRVAESPTERY